MVLMLGLSYATYMDQTNSMHALIWAMARIIIEQKPKLQDAFEGNLVSIQLLHYQFLWARWLAIRWLSFIKTSWVQILIRFQFCAPGSETAPFGCRDTSW